MILTCHKCPKQLCFHGTDRNLFAKLFGWIVSGKRYFCTACGESDA